MRDPKRIPAVLARIELLWNENPDMRLGQLIVNLARGIPAFHIEDDKLSERAHRVLAHGWPALNDEATP